MLVSLRIVSILFDLFLGVIFFYRPLSQKEKSRRICIFTSLLLFFHALLTILFSGANLFLVGNLILSIAEYYFLGLYFGYAVQESSFWIFCQMSLTLLAGTILNQAVQLFSPLSVISENLIAMLFYLAVAFLLSLLVTLVLRQLFRAHQKLVYTASVSKGTWLYQFIVPFLSICFAFTISAIQGQVFEKDYLSFVSVLALIVLTFSSLYFTLYLSQQQQRYYQSILETEQLTFQLREMKQSKKDYRRIQRIQHDLKNQHLILLALLKENPEQAKSYLQSMTNSIENQTVCYSKNTTINFLLNQKLQDKVEDIQLEIDCFVPQRLEINPDILAVLLGNLLDNSLEACMRLSNKEDRVLILGIRYFQKKLFIAIENSFDEDELVMRKERQTEGWGLKNIERLVTNHRGIIKNFIQNGRHKTEVILPV
ncbi:GHKL domain-containing protein [Streptococcus sp. Marseille-Q5986]|uniref:GHKL domain-containing protein n=1 Tax=Streptococcus sp. Marseille-Q5986 TaxID=2972782 RepID=UPI0022653ECA|nr:GHKL domain-containing protein [Streptococcus sp. Marseille-Q5986]